jgi:transketolase
MNGLALHKGTIPFGGTFLVFADYMRGAIRLSALQGQRVVYVLTHDSIGLGEDGPTHQPVETLASLRAIPNLVVLRPADPVETAEAWDIALKRADGPTAISLTRQAVPALRTTHTSENLSARGGYVLADADGARKATLLATGSEVGLAMTAREALQKDGIPTAVVSLPSWELFDAQDAAYRQKVLGTGVVRVAVEAAVKMGWEKYLGPDGGFVGMSGFGASAPAPALFKHFGITAEAVAAAVRTRL